MKLKIKDSNRKPLVKALEDATGMKRVYLGPPSFTYEVGEYSVLRDRLEIQDCDVNNKIIHSLIAKDLVEEQGDVKGISFDFPMEGQTGKTLLNLVNMIRCRQMLLNQALGRPGAFHIDEKAREKLSSAAPETAGDFILEVGKLGASKFKGVTFENNWIHFTGFPYTLDAETNRAYKDIAGLMCKAALESEHIKWKSDVVTNPKYSFRVWLIRLGMNGDEYKTTRQVLLSNLPGSAAFRTSEQAVSFKARMKEKRDAEKKDKSKEFTSL